MPTHLLNLSLILLAISGWATQPLSAQPEPPGISTTRLEKVTDLVSDYVERGQLPGAVYAVQHRGELAGLRSVGDFQNDSLFRIYSMTKPITVVATLALYEDGEFLLSDPISRYLPEFAQSQVLEIDTEGRQRLRPAERPITIEQLLTHTSGLSYDDSAPGVPRIYAESNLWEATSLADFSKRLAQLPLAFEPGERWHYSVANDLLGRLIEVVSGMPFDAFLKQRVLDPLGMTDTSFFVPEQKQHRLPPLHRWDGERMVMDKTPEDSPYLNPNVIPYGGSGLVSTASDYLKFCQMLLNGGEFNGSRILGRQTVALMLMNHLDDRFPQPKLNEFWVSQTENRTGNLNLGLGFGYGGYVITDIATNAVPGSAGTFAWGGYASSYFFIDPKENLAGVFMTQLIPSTAFPLRAQFRGLVNQALGARAEP